MLRKKGVIMHTPTNKIIDDELSTENPFVADSPEILQSVYITLQWMRMGKRKS
jgi:hypothetical protein